MVRTVRSLLPCLLAGAVALARGTPADAAPPVPGAPISGIVRSGEATIPGVTVVVRAVLRGGETSTSLVKSEADGTFVLRTPRRASTRSSPSFRGCRSPWSASCTRPRPTRSPSCASISNRPRASCPRRRAERPILGTHVPRTKATSCATSPPSSRRSTILRRRPPRALLRRWRQARRTVFPCAPPSRRPPVSRVAAASRAPRPPSAFPGAWAGTSAGAWTGATAASTARLALHPGTPRRWPWTSPPGTARTCASPRSGRSGFSTRATRNASPPTRSTGRRRPATGRRRASPRDSSRSPTRSTRDRPRTSSRARRTR